jgi:hypothetical protein
MIAIKPRADEYKFDIKLVNKRLRCPYCGMFELSRYTDSMSSSYASDAYCKGRFLTIEFKCGFDVEIDKQGLVVRQSRWAQCQKRKSETKGCPYVCPICGTFKSTGDGKIISCGSIINEEIGVVDDSTCSYKPFWISWLAPEGLT